jgi:hypothetical protein
MSPVELFIGFDPHDGGQHHCERQQRRHGSIARFIAHETSRVHPSRHSHKCGRLAAVPLAFPFGSTSRPPTVSDRCGWYDPTTLNLSASATTSYRSPSPAQGLSCQFVPASTQCAVTRKWVRNESTPHHPHGYHAYHRRQLQPQS